MVLDTGACEERRRDNRWGTLYDATNRSESFLPPSRVVNLPYIANGSSLGHFPSAQQFEVSLKEAQELQGRGSAGRQCAGTVTWLVCRSGHA